MRTELKGLNGVGRVVGGGWRGRKPLARETVKGGRVDSPFGSVGMVSRTGKVGGGMLGSILASRLWKPCG